VPDRRREGRPRPLTFGVHQGIEYLAGVLLALTAIRLPADAATPGLAAALAVVGLALLTDGPLGGFRLIGRRAHQALDILFLMVLAASPAVLGFDNLSVVILAEALAVVFAVLAVRTSYASNKRRAVAAEPPPPPSRTPAPTATGETMRVAGRVAGRAVGRVGRDGPRALGRFVGRRTKR
jgi:hypothetical protein